MEAGTQLRVSDMKVDAGAILTAKTADI